MHTCIHLQTLFLFFFFFGAETLCGILSQTEPVSVCGNGWLFSSADVTFTADRWYFCSNQFLVCVPCLLMPSSAHEPFAEIRSGLQVPTRQQQQQWLWWLLIRALGVVIFISLCSAQGRMLIYSLCGSAVCLSAPNFVIFFY